MLPVVVLTDISLVADNVDIFPLAVYISSAEKYLFTPCLHFLNWVSLMLTLSCYPRTFERVKVIGKRLRTMSARIKHTNDEIRNRRFPEWSPAGR